MTGTDWTTWHDPYDDPGSPLARRLRCVQGHIDRWLDDRGPTPGRVVSICAGQGRDLLEVLGRRHVRVDARLVEADPDNVAHARALAASYRLDGVEVVTGDAGRTGAYTGAVPADLVLACGVFGNVSDDDVRRTVEALPQLCAAGATVIWTRARRAPDLTPALRGWFAGAGFTEVAFEAPADVLWSVGVHRFDGVPRPLEPDAHLFTFEV